MLQFKEIRNARRVKMTDEEYFGPDYKDYASNSGLGLLNKLQGGSPSRYLAGFKESTSSLEIGSLVHQLILEEDIFEYKGVTYPSKGEKAILEYMAEYGLELNVESYKESAIATDYYKGRYSANRYAAFNCPSNIEYLAYLKRQDKHELAFPRNKSGFIENVVERAKNSKLFNSLLHPENAESYFEDAILCDIVVDVDGKDVIIPFKCKVDNFTLKDDTIIINDLKTSSKGFRSFIGQELAVDAQTAQPVDIEAQKSSFVHWHYFRQAAIYSLIMQAVYPNHKILGFNFLVISTGQEPDDGVAYTTQEAMNKGIKEFKDLICELARCITYGFEDEKPDEDLLKLFNL